MAAVGFSSTTAPKPLALPARVPASAETYVIGNPAATGALAPSGAPLCARRAPGSAPPRHLDFREGVAPRLAPTHPDPPVPTMQ